MSIAYTHTVRKPLVGYVRRGTLHNHRDAQPGRRHAANVVAPLRLRTLCGQTIDLTGDLDPLAWDDVPENYVRPAGEHSPTCRRCVAMLARIPTSSAAS